MLKEYKLKWRDKIRLERELSKNVHAREQDVLDLKASELKNIQEILLNAEDRLKIADIMFFRSCAEEECAKTEHQVLSNKHRSIDKGGLGFWGWISGETFAQEEEQTEESINLQQAFKQQDEADQTATSARILASIGLFSVVLENDLVADSQFLLGVELRELCVCVEKRKHLLGGMKFTYSLAALNVHGPGEKLICGPFV